MKEIRTTADIHASPQQVWAALEDLSAYKDWNPYITRAEGEVEVGGTLTLRLELPGGETLTVSPSCWKPKLPGSCAGCGPKASAASATRNSASYSSPRVKTGPT